MFGSMQSIDSNILKLVLLIQIHTISEFETAFYNFFYFGDFCIANIPAINKCFT